MMNMLLKQRLKDLVIELQEIEYEYKLSIEKIIMTRDPTLKISKKIKM